jgi:hypothetical protein
MMMITVTEENGGSEVIMTMTMMITVTEGNENGEVRGMREWGSEVMMMMTIIMNNNDNDGNKR